jgi:putative FmdB family regulatory protein
MPFYEYECPSCKFYSEVLQKISDRPLKKCPSCGKPGFRKLVSAPVFRLKGSGWYETDFKSDKDNQRNLAGPEREESGGDTKPGASAKAATDSKTDSKSDSKADAKGEVKGEAKASGDAKPAAESKGSKQPKENSSGGRGGRSRSGSGGKSGARSGAKKPAPRAAARKSPKRGGKRR